VAAVSASEKLAAAAVFSNTASQARFYFTHELQRKAN